ncbi:hypothetical protein [Paenibacillus tarimensis]|uniref:hypothetical protein n=1 Tax=Paenibacillus tarimensis TaxID=416012 RepID=UPI001F39B408|nr:hypothetical protein [Paenibacillus tarimensis]MCF2946300.1 hypothetical protein [Paenibacillus tarimensis]
MEQHLVTSRKGQRRPAGGSPKGIFIALAVLLVAAAAAVWMSRQPGGEGLAPGISGTNGSLREDAAKLWDWADDELAGGAEKAGWSARWDSSMTAEETAVLMKKLELTPSSKDRAEQDGPLFRVLLWREEGIGLPGGEAGSSGAESSQPGVTETEVEAEEHDSRSVLLFEGSPGLARSDFLQRISLIDSLLDASAGRSLTFRGEARSVGSGERIAEAADASRVESYDGGGTASDVYFTSGLRLYTYSGDNKVNLQLASHWDREAGRLQLTGGVPLITGDYSRVP